jgi:TonB family protein
MDAVLIRGDWVGQVIDGKFPLIEWLGGSGSGAVFRTELGGDVSRKAAIKLVPASARTEERLATWPAIAALSHPHLLRILQAGRAEIGEVKLVYVVTEFAEEVLAQIIPERPLSADETREMLNPVLGALQYIHDKGYVHGHLKPSNILVVDEDIKLSSDSMLPEGNLSPEPLGNDIHIAPESAEGPVARPMDIWSLGITLVEALTQHPPIWDAAAGGEPVVPRSVPEPFSTIARESLHPDPARRCTLTEMRKMLEGRQTQSAATAPLHLPHYQQRIAEKSLPARIPLLPLIIGFVLLVAIIVGLEMRSHKTHSAPLQTESTRQAPAAEPDSKTANGSTAPSVPAATPPSVPAPATAPIAGPTKGEVVSRSVPDVPRQASNTIHGTVGVVVRVEADTNGAVTGAELATRGPSAYFARLALESARNWKFKPPQQDGHATSSTWLLHYAFRRGGVDVRAEEKTR